MAFGDFRKKPNLVLLITDQESGKPYWPAGWAEAHLPAMSRLREHGLTFTDGYTNSCTCSPSRTTLFTGLYPDAIVWPKVSGGDAFVTTGLPDREVDPDNLME
jgi:arylsulfatase A-like enzyme